MTDLEKLLSIASEAFLADQRIASCLDVHGTSVATEVQSMLDRKNGFTVFESALVVFPSGDGGCVLGLDSWNHPAGWRRWYPASTIDKTIFFSHDIFGVQFGISDVGVVRLNPETGEVEHYAGSLEEWANILLARYEEDSGWPVAHEWQIENRPIEPSERLLPLQPFVLGGDYVVENLKAVNAKYAMEKWGSLCRQIHAVPDGKEVTIEGWID